MYVGLSFAGTARFTQARFVAFLHVLKIDLTMQLNFFRHCRLFMSAILICVADTDPVIKNA